MIVWCLLTELVLFFHIDKIFHLNPTEIFSMKSNWPMTMRLLKVSLILRGTEVRLAEPSTVWWLSSLPILYEQIQRLSNLHPSYTPLHVPHLIRLIPQGLDQVWAYMPHIDKICICKVEKFCDKVNNDPVRVEYKLENTLRVLNELICSLEDCLRCVISLLKEEGYQGG